MPLTEVAYAEFKSAVLAPGGAWVALQIDIESNRELFEALRVQHDFGLTTVPYWKSCEVSADCIRPVLVVEFGALDPIALTLVFDLEAGEATAVLPLLVQLEGVTAQIVWKAGEQAEESFEISFGCRPTDTFGHIQGALDAL